MIIVSTLDIYMSFYYIYIYIHYIIYEYNKYINAHLYILLSFYKHVFWKMWHHIRIQSSQRQDYVSSEQMMKALEAVGHPFRLEDAPWSFFFGIARLMPCWLIVLFSLVYTFNAAYTYTYTYMITHIYIYIYT